MFGQIKFSLAILIVFSFNIGFSQNENVIKEIERNLLYAQMILDSNKLDTNFNEYIEYLNNIKEACDKNFISKPVRYYYMMFLYSKIEIDMLSSCYKKYSNFYIDAVKYGEQYIYLTDNSSNESTLKRRKEIINFTASNKEKIDEITNVNKKIEKNYILRIGNLDTIVSVKTIESFLNEFCEPCGKNTFGIEKIKLDGINKTILVSDLVQRIIEIHYLENFLIYKDSSNISTTITEIINKELINYIFTFPEGFFKIQINNYVQKELDWVSCIESKDYEGYIKNNPNSKYFNQAKDSLTSIDIRDYNEATNLNTLTALLNYTSKHPNGKYIDEVNDKINALNRKQKNKENIRSFFGGNTEINSAIYTEYSVLFSKSFSYFHKLFGPFGYNCDILTLYDKDKFIQRGFSFIDLSLLTSINKGFGFYFIIGYSPQVFRKNKTNKTYFFSNSSLPNSGLEYQPSMIEIKNSNFHYGIGYHNSFNKFYIGADAQLNKLLYKAERFSDINFSGLNRQIESFIISLKLGYAF